MRGIVRPADQVQRVVGMTNRLTDGRKKQLTDDGRPLNETVVQWT